MGGLCDCHEYDIIYSVMDLLSSKIVTLLRFEGVDSRALGILCFRGEVE